MINYLDLDVRRKLYRRAFIYVLLIAFFFNNHANAHQAPYSIAYLDVSPNSVAVELLVPLSELELAYGNDISKDPANLIKRMGPQLKEYFLAHTHAFVHRELPWLIDIKDMQVREELQMESGPPFYELRLTMILLPQNSENTRDFMFDYDAVVHQVVNHIVFVSIRSDWQTGRADSLTADGNPMTIRTGNDNKVHPLEITLRQGSWWNGIRNMIGLGMHHIKDGTDHLLFLLVLLLPAMLKQHSAQWGMYGGTRYSVKNILGVVTAFTIGHSLTLLAGALNFINIPSQPVEVLIACSILVSAIHAIVPVFKGKEKLIAGGFGLIHGLAFASILGNLHISKGVLLLSITGFNIGIELMQLIVVLTIMPWLMLLSKSILYKYFRVFGASLAIIAAIGWIVERISGEKNIIGDAIVKVAGHPLWMVAGLSVTATISYFVSKKHIADVDTKLHFVRRRAY